jgi:hypothetical protein
MMIMDPLAEPLAIHERNSFYYIDYQDHLHDRVRSCWKDGWKKIGKKIYETDLDGNDWLNCARFKRN